MVLLANAKYPFELKRVRDDTQADTNTRGAIEFGS